MSKINLNQIKHLALEGGGGKGIVYLGAIEALEQKYKMTLDSAVKKGENIFPKKVPSSAIPPKIYPLFPLRSLPKDRPLQGISGSSAGAITAFMLSLGMSSVAIREEMEKTTTAVIAKENITISIFETFFEAPNPFKTRVFMSNNQRYYEYKNLNDYLIKAKDVGKKSSSVLSAYLDDKQVKDIQSKKNFMLSRLLLSDVSFGKKYGKPKGLKCHVCVSVPRICTVVAGFRACPNLQLSIWRFVTAPYIAYK